MPAPIRILIVDDSAFARKVVREILSGSPWVEVVGVARDGKEALELTASLHPDLVICDLRMPIMDGVTFVQQQMSIRPLPILIVSAAAQDAAEVVEALSAGAIGVVQKPNALATDDLKTIRDALVEKVREAMNAPVENLAPHFVPAAPAASVASTRRATKADVVVIGISTGGPQALRRMLPLLPADFPVPIAIVIHMPVGYTALYADRLDQLCAIEVKEASEGDVLRPGCALLAAAGRHLLFTRAPDGKVVAHYSMQPLEKLHRPSVDVLFKSAADIYRERVLAVVMTGMGEDGKEGAAWIKALGGTVLTESKISCVIYGMPRVIVELGLSDLAVPLEDLAQTIVSRL